MLKVNLSTDDPGAEPAPCFATHAEIELADRLRRQLEEHYFGPMAEPSHSKTRSGEVH
jgi:hypothetical protein